MRARRPTHHVRHRIARRRPPGWWREAGSSSGHAPAVFERSCFASRRSAHGSSPCLCGLIQPPVASRRHFQAKRGLNAARNAALQAGARYRLRFSPPSTQVVGFGHGEVPPIMADARPCALCGGGDEEGLVLKCDECDVPLHAHCVGYTGRVEGDWFCRGCEDQPVDSPRATQCGEEAFAAGGARAARTGRSRSSERDRSAHRGGGEGEGSGG